ncbi:uncharacterized protein LOC120905858 [Anopheles arabiensis]|uniref:uncharacterized protein LOC120905858 n=1 Tax=Anopheles arabiensis TaxID=7173 RepID=UPI001AACA8A1|nr:uncharacterized protein LOC120905858 [Anopheles arabiensis]
MHLKVETKRVPLQQLEYEKAEQALLKMAQVDCFIDELKILMKNKNRPTNLWINFEKGSALYELSPMLDEHDIIRVEGRMERAEFLPFSLRFPIILPSDHRVTRLIVRHHHEKSGHGYREAVKNELRQLYHIIHLDATVRKEAAACVWCKRFATTTEYTGA